MRSTAERHHSEWGGRWDHDSKSSKLRQYCSTPKWLRLRTNRSERSNPAPTATASAAERSIVRPNRAAKIQDRSPRAWIPRRTKQSSERDLGKWATWRCMAPSALFLFDEQPAGMSGL